MKIWVLFLALSVQAADLTGKWSGAPFYMVLQQNGDTVTGQAGPGEKELYPIQDAVLDGDHFTFKVSAFAFDLHIKGDEIRGELKNGQQNMPVFLRRVIEGASVAPAVFDAASVKPAPPEAGQGSRMQVTAGRLTMTNVPLKQILLRAYDVADYQVSGPDWLNTERFEIMASMPPDTATSRVQDMLKNLLTERFHMVLHRESREMNVYGLVVGKKGVKMKEVPWAPGQRSASQGHLTGNSVTIAAIADFLSHVVDRPVIDMSGSKAHYEVDLTWTPETRQGGAAESAPSTNAADPTARTIFQAVEEQLGLRLEMRKAPVEVIVIDRADKVPIAN